jgi:3-phosphoshikimate 1-carboxyvinyltransferase
MFQVKFIKPSNVKGIIKAPSSKSDMLRAIAAAYLTGARCELRNPSSCDDAQAALGIVQTLGVQLDEQPERIVFTPGTRMFNPILDCGESGLCIRMFPSIAALLKDKVTLIGHGSLTTRPLGMIEQPLRDLGVECHTQRGFLPVTVKGPLKAGKTVVDGSTTSQFLTGLLMALPLCKGQSEIVVNKLTSKPYIAMTLNLMQTFGVEVQNENFERFIIQGPQKYNAIAYNVEGDWSGAAFLLVAGAIAGSVKVENIRFDSCQADKAIVDVLKLAGAKVEIGEYDVKVQSADLSGFEFDAADCPDLFPPIVALASYCQGKSIIYGAQRLKVKESDRGTALLNEFRKIGASVALYADRMEITGTAELDGGTVDSYNDHRIAMAGAVAGLKSKQGVTIRDWECVAKSYPGFFDDLTKISI